MNYPQLSLDLYLLEKHKSISKYNKIYLTTPLQLNIPRAVYGCCRILYKQIY